MRTNQQNALYRRNLKKREKSKGCKVPGSSVNWDSDSQRKFWNAGIRSTCKPSARKPGAWAEVLGLVSSLNLERPRILETLSGFSHSAR
jgi:hypothetical protein